jgi:hypothetical protein
MSFPSFHLSGLAFILPSHPGVIHYRIIELFKQIQQFPDFYRVMLGAQADTFLSQRFRQQTQQRVLAYFHQTFPEAASDPNTPPLDLYAQAEKMRSLAFKRRFSFTKKRFLSLVKETVTVVCFRSSRWGSSASKMFINGLLGCGLSTSRPRFVRASTSIAV